MHAVLITAYKDYRSLLRLTRRLDPTFFKLYVHIDKRSAIGRSEIKELRNLGCHVSKSYTIRWGSFSHLQAIMDLIQRAVNYGGVDYLHIISGQDYPLSTVKDFKRRCDGRIFINYRALHDEPNFIKDRYRLLDPFYFLLGGPTGLGKVYQCLDRPSRWIQRSLGFSRTQFGPFNSLYKAIVWSSFPTSAAKRLISDELAKQFLRSIRQTTVAEEIFLPTYFLNSELAPLVVADDLRYTDWRRRNGGVPAFLDESDHKSILQSNALFARKISSEISSGLLDHIDQARFGGPPPGF